MQKKLTKREKREKRDYRLKMEANEKSKVVCENWQNRGVFSSDSKPSEVRRVEITPEMKARYER